jgi:dephospho-CoA kinase
VPTTSPAPDVQPPASRAARAAAWVPAGERVILAIGPSPLFVLLSSAGVIGMVVVAAAALQWASDRFTVGLSSWPLLTGAAIVVGVVVWNALVAQNRSYVLTERRVLRAAGVFRRIITEVPLRNIQHLELTRLVRERVFGLGSIGFNTAGTAWTEMYWVMVARPADVLRMVRDAAEGGPPGAAMEAKVKIPVIGLAGGVGSGKSAVARAFARLGAVVIDSDHEARAALDLPEVKRQLTEWWGPGVFNLDGSVSRKAVADIVFKNPDQRRKLENLIHPLVKHQRAAIVERAREAGAPAAVIDAPLLFEANIDAECDAVVFVDAPRALRLERVQATRGWDEAELSRRESAQIPLEQKQGRSAFVIRNLGSEQELELQAARVFREIIARFGPAQARS